jgi:hypothetical protein
MNVWSGLEQPKLEKVRIAGTTFLVDRERQELREENDKNNRIPFDRLRARQGEEGINIVFDKLKRNLYTGYLNEQGLPVMTERVFLSSSIIDKGDNTRQWQGQWNKQDEHQKVKKRNSITRKL